jgi:hypothetical protein
MPLLNYTTKIPVRNSVEAIQKTLVKAGARNISQDYDTEGMITAVSFTIILSSQSINFRLPSDWRAVAQVMRNDKVPRALQTDEQAQRVSWRIIKDWIEAQMAIVATKMVTLPQVFLPYAVNKNGSTLYEIVAQNPNLLLGDGNE